MKVQRLTLCHEDDLGDMKSPQLFVTDDHRLLVRGSCRKCGAQVNCFISLTDLYKMCPSQELAPVQFTDRDRHELHAMHITLPED